MLLVHHLNNSRSQRVLWLLEELELTYDIRLYRRNRDMSAPAEMKRIHPLGKSPIVEDISDHDRRIVLVETGAICEYLVARTGGRMGPPDDLEGTERYHRFLHYAEGSVMPILFTLLVVSKIPLFGRLAAGRLWPMLDLHLDYVEQELSNRAWFAGEILTAADVMMSFPLEAAAKRGRIGADRPATSSWLKRIHDRPAYRRALERGGRYGFAT